MMSLALGIVGWKCTGQNMEMSLRELAEGTDIWAKIWGENIGLRVTHYIDCN